MFDHCLNKWGTIRYIRNVPLWNQWSTCLKSKSQKARDTWKSENNWRPRWSLPGSTMPSLLWGSWTVTVMHPHPKIHTGMRRGEHKGRVHRGSLLHSLGLAESSVLPSRNWGRKYPKTRAQQCSPQSPYCTPISDEAESHQAFKDRSFQCHPSSVNRKSTVSHSLKTGQPKPKTIYENYRTISHTTIWKTNSK